MSFRAGPVFKLHAKDEEPKGCIHPFAFQIPTHPTRPAETSLAHNTAQPEEADLPSLPPPRQRGPGLSGLCESTGVQDGE